MQITTYRETYHQPTRMIEVPKELQDEGFVVSFERLPIETTMKKSDVSQPTQLTYTESVQKVGGILGKYTDKKLTIEEMNQSVARMFAEKGRDL